jgi:CHAD domain-containing protein
MAYRLKSGRSIGKQLSRIVRKELARVIGEMDDAAHDPEGVFDARKRIKKIRAVLHLLRSPLARDFRIHDQALRNVAHHLAASRDADAAVEILAAVRKHYPAQMTRTIVAAVRRGLTRRKRGAESRLNPAQLRRNLRRSAPAIPQAVRRAADRTTVRDGVVDGYKRARRAMRDVRTVPADAGFHKWRRRVKDHWYHVRLLQRMRPSGRSRAARLKQLETWLGDDHNLVTLGATLLQTPSAFGDERTTTIVLGCIEKYQATLRKQALKLGARLFQQKGAAYARALSRHSKRRM